MYRGVYALGHRKVTRGGAWMAAVLAAGPSAVLSHRSAAALWGVRNGAPATVEVIAPRQCRRPGIRAHHLVLPADEITIENGIPVTNPARTLFDLAAVVTPQQLRHALNEAEIRRLSSPLSLDALVARHPRRRGTSALKRALDHQRQIGETVTKSHMERRFLALLDAHALPRPRTNEPLGPYFPDALWPSERVVVELDSYGIHTTRQAFERDRERDRKLQANGYRVVRIPWRQLTSPPKATPGDPQPTPPGDPRPRESPPRARPAPPPPPAPPRRSPPPPAPAPTPSR